MNILKRFIQDMKSRSREQRRKDIKDEFQIKEIGKEFYVIHNGMAIYQFQPTETSVEMAEILNRFRLIALAYADKII